MKPIRVIFSEKTGYLVKELYDVSQVDAPSQEKIKYEHDIQDKVDAIMAGSPVRHQKRNDIADPGTHFMYEPNDELIYYKPGVDSLEQIFIELSREHSHYALKELLGSKERLVSLGIRTDRTDMMKYSRGVYKPIADTLGFLISDIYKVTEFTMTCPVMPDVPVDPDDARTILGIYTEAGRSVRRMYESGLEKVEFLKNEYRKQEKEKKKGGGNRCFRSGKE